MGTELDRESINEALVKAYDRMAHLRDFDRYEEWKRVERRNFASQLMSEGKTRLLELGCGTGRDTHWFSENGFQVTGIDLSPEMVQVCARKGLDARVMDFANPDFDAESFDALYALNALVHTSVAELEGALRSLVLLLKPGGLFYLGQYGGTDFEGVLERDNYRPKRYFSFPSREVLKPILEKVFTVEAFEIIELEGRDYAFYSCVLRAG